jgi:4-carboxymuconolactone decarboxylase
MPETEQYRKGREIRRRLLGDAYVDRVGRTSYANPIMREFIDYATEHIFGALWSRPGLDLKTRAFVCVISDAATGQHPELGIHLRMARREGWTETELTEALMHLVGYIGAPAAREALLTARQVFEELRTEGMAS